MLENVTPELQKAGTNFWWMVKSCFVMCTEMTKATIQYFYIKICLKRHTYCCLTTNSASISIFYQAWKKTMDTGMVSFLPYPDMEDQLVFRSVGLYASSGTVKKAFFLTNTSLSLTHTTEFWQFHRNLHCFVDACHLLLVFQKAFT